MTTQTTRRGLIGGAGLAGVMLIAPAVAAVKMPAATTIRWDALVADFHRADGYMKARGIEHTVACDRYNIERAKLGACPKAPDYSSDAYPKPIDKMTIGEIRSTVPTKSQKYAAYEAAYADWKAKDDALEASITGDIEARWEAAVDAQDKAAHALFNEPSPNADALRFKMQLVEQSYEGCEIDSYVAKAIFADVRRLLSKEA
jgi:hypothetical protein